ncbi:MAG: hypothetical protein Q9211_001139 [Gyalolechia sp. 1 TL-2023]
MSSAISNLRHLTSFFFDTKPVEEVSRPTQLPPLWSFVQNSTAKPEEDLDGQNLLEDKESVLSTSRFQQGHIAFNEDCYRSSESRRRRELLQD